MNLRSNIKVSMYILLNDSLECLPNYEYLDIHESWHLSFGMLKVSFYPQIADTFNDTL